MPLWVLILANIIAYAVVACLMVKRWKAREPAIKAKPRLVRIRNHSQKCPSCKKALDHYSTQLLCIQEGAHYYHPHCYHSMVFVAFYDTFAWVAGTTTYASVGQGPTLEEAVASLQRVLVGESVLARNLGKAPFLADEASKLPTDPFLLQGTETTYMLGDAGDPTKRYHGWVRLLDAKQYYLN